MVTEQWHKVAGIDGLNLLHREGGRETSSLVLERETTGPREEEEKKMVMLSWYARTGFSHEFFTLFPLFLSTFSVKLSSFFRKTPSVFSS